MLRNQHARTRVKLGYSLFVLSFGLLAAGCGSKGNITGKVTYNGKPLTGGMVTFLPEEGKAAFNAKIDKEGNYHLAKVSIGKMRIGVVSLSSRLPPSPMMAKMMKEMKAKKKEFTKEELDKMPAEYRETLSPSSELANEVPIPKQYNDPEKSGLEYTVIGGEQEYNIELK